MVAPANGATFIATTVTFQWNAGTGVSDYWLYVSSVAAGGDELYNVEEGTSLSQSVSGLPSNGSTVYVRLWSKIGSTWLYRDYTYKAVTLVPTAATMTSPANGSTLPGTNVTFQWNTGVGVSDYWLYVSAVSAGGFELYNADMGTATSHALSGLPANGGTIYVRLWSLIGSTWTYVDYTYKAA